MLEHLYVHYDDGAVSPPVPRRGRAWTRWCSARARSSARPARRCASARRRHHRPRAQRAVPAGAARRQALARRDRHRPGRAQPGRDRARPGGRPRRPARRQARPRRRRRLDGRPDRGHRLTAPGPPRSWSPTARPSARPASPRQYDATAIPLADLALWTGRVDVLVSCTGAAGDAARPRPDRCPAHRPTQPLAVVDLALPRDVDPAVADLPGVRLVALDTLAAELEDAPGGADVDGVRTIVEPGAGGLPHRPPQPERDPDGGGAAHDGHRRRRGRAGPARRAGCPTLDDASPRRGREDHPPGRGEAAPPARPCASSSWPTSPAPCPTPPRWPSCSPSTPRPSRP